MAGVLAAPCVIGPQEFILGLLDELAPVPDALDLDLYAVDLGGQTRPAVEPIPWLVDVHFERARPENNGRRPWAALVHAQAKEARLRIGDGT
jgi:hypothetical protein